MNKSIKSLLLANAVAFAGTAVADGVNLTWTDGTHFQQWDGSSITQGAATTTVKISGENVAYEIFDTIQFSNGVTGKQIANGTSFVYDTTLDISGERVAYRDGDNIKLYDGSTTSSVYEDSSGWGYFSPRNISVSDSLVAYQLQEHAYNGYDRNFYIFDGSQSYALNTLAGKSAAFQSDMALDGDTVVWAHGSYPGTTGVINVWDNGSQTYNEITHNNLVLNQPDASGDKVVFVGKATASAAYGSIYTWDNGTITDISAQDGTIQHSPKISGNKVAFLGKTVFSGADLDVFVFDGQNTIRLTDNNSEERNVQISGDYVSWESFDGNDYEVFLWDGSTVTQITDNNVDDVNAQVETIAEATNGIADGSYLIQNVQTGAYLNLDYGNASNGTNVHTWSCETCSENHWTVEALPEGGYKIVIKSAPWIGLDVDTNSNNLHVWSFWGGGSNQKFDIVNANSGLGQHFYIDPQHSNNEVLAVPVNASGNGQNVSVESQTGTYSQQWKFIALP